MINTVSQKFHRATYSEMESMGKLTLIESDSLRQKIIRYYTERLTNVYEWHAIDRDQALPDITRFYNGRLPFAPLYQFQGVNAEDSTKIYDTVNSSEFKNQIQFNRIIKSGVRQQYLAMQQEAEDILDLLSEELE